MPAITPYDSDFNPGSFDVGIPTTPTPTPAGFPTSWDVTCNDALGTIVCSYPDAIVVSITWNLNAPDEAEITLPLDDPNVFELAPDNPNDWHEVQIARNGHFLFKGYPTTRRVDSSKRVWTITLKDRLWYLSRRYIGRANRTNYLHNGGFENVSLDHWSSTGSLTATQDTTIVLVGTKSLKLVGTSSGENFENQRFTVTSGALGLALFLTAWVYISSFTAAAGSNRGIRLQRLGASGLGSIGVQELVSSTPRLGWVRMSCFVNMPPNVTETLEAALYAINGTVYWDAATVTVEQSVAFFPEADVATIINRVVNYAQGKGPFGVYSPEKSDLHIGLNTPATGLSKQRVYQLADHQKIFDGGNGSGVLDEFLKDNTLDIDLVETRTTTTLTTYRPTRGVDRSADGSGWVFSYHKYPSAPERDGHWGIVSWDFGESVEQTANNVCELGGWGGGPDNFATREEGGFEDAAALNGLTLEVVESAPQNMPIGFLDALADARGALLENPVRTPTFSLAEPRDPITDEVTDAFIGIVLPGDTLAVDIVDGNLQLVGNYRISKVVLDGATERLAITPNPA